MDKLSLEATGVPLQQLPVNAVEPERDGRGMFHFVPPTLGRLNVLVEKPFNATAVQITHRNRQHDKALDRHMLHANVTNALKQQ